MEERSLKMEKSTGSKLFFLSFFIWTFYLEIQTITMYQAFLPAVGFVVVRLLTYTLLMGKGFRELYLFIKGKEFQGITWKSYLPFLSGIVFVTLCLVVALVSKDTIIFDISLLIFSARNQNIKKIMETFIYMQLAIMVICVLGVEFGWVKDRIFWREGMVLRHSLGYAWTSLPAQMFFYLSLTLLFIREWDFYWYDILLIVGGSSFWYYYTDTKSPFFLTMLLMIVLLILKAKQAYFLEANWFQDLIVASIPVSGISVVLWSYAYQETNPFFKIANKLLSNRLSLGKAGIRENGFSFVGQEIEFVDNITQHLHKNQKLSYNFIDSSFLQIAITKGVLFFVVLLILLTIVTWKLVRNGQLIGGVIFAFICLHSMMDPQLLDLWISPFPLLLGKQFSVSFKEDSLWWNASTQKLL